LTCSTNTNIGFAELEEALEWSIYPNPVKDYFVVKGAANKIGKAWSLLNSTGECLMKGQVTQAEFSVLLKEEMQQKGVFYLTIGDEACVLIIP
jgi:hypothetical protein